MAFLSIPGVAIRGLAACIPPPLGADENRAYPLLPAGDIEKLISTIGVERKRMADAATCSSDLCFVAAERLISDLRWNREEIGYLVFVTQTPDYITPATACILQQRLRLSVECMAFDINLGCSGWVYGLSVLSSLVSHGKGKGLLLAGDTISKFISKEDKSTWPLFGDAGSATALEYADDSPGIKFHLASDGEGMRAIWIRDGGYRHPASDASFVPRTFDEGIRHNDLQLVLDGMSVFSFGISRAPESVNQLLGHFDIDREAVDYYTFHQANLFMNEKIRKKLKLPAEKVPYSLRNFGNTSCATIPLTLVSELQGRLVSSKLTHVGCAFGVGLSWGSAYFETDHIVCPELIDYEL